jgi:polyhydroxyalkanoate synthesis regulator phasin
MSTKTCPVSNVDFSKTQGDVQELRDRINILETRIALLEAKQEKSDV